MGYYDAKRVIKKFSGIRYYIMPVDNDLFFKCISLISDQTINKIADTLFISHMHPKRMLFEKIFPTLAKILKLDNDSNYQDIIIATLEYLAEEYNLEKYQIQTFEIFLKNLRNLSEEREHIQDTDEFSDKKLNLSSVFSGEFILKKIAFELVNELRPEQFV
jgi:hypothetical protein